MNGGSMKDPMKPLAPTMADELDNLERVRQYMSARDYQDYIEKRALEALIKYRKHHNLEDLEEMQFFMHRITHSVIEGAKISEIYKRQLTELEKLNLMARIYEGDDG
jgi:hypothetical protein